MAEKRAFLGFSVWHLELFRDQEAGGSNLRRPKWPHVTETQLAMVLMQRDLAGKYSICGPASFAKSTSLGEPTVRIISTGVDAEGAAPTRVAQAQKWVTAWVSRHVVATCYGLLRHLSATCTPRFGPQKAT